MYTNSLCVCQAVHSTGEEQGPTQTLPNPSTQTPSVHGTPTCMSARRRTRLECFMRNSCASAASPEVTRTFGTFQRWTCKPKSESKLKQCFNCPRGHLPHGRQCWHEIWWCICQNVHWLTQAAHPASAHQSSPLGLGNSEQSVTNRLLPAGQQMARSVMTHTPHLGVPFI